MQISGRQGRSPQGPLQVATFLVGELRVGVQIHCVQEITRQLALAHVAHAPACVRGVMNLRGDVVTVIDPRVVLGMSPAVCGKLSRNVIIQFDDELIGLWVDEVLDILSIPEADIEPPPANINSVDGRFFVGVYSQSGRIITLLDLDAVLTSGCEYASESSS